MIRRLQFFIIGVFAAGSIIPVSSIAAEDGFTINDLNHTVSFPGSISFQLDATTDADIVDARLNYKVDRQSFAEIFNEVIVGISPAQEVNLSYSLNLRRVGGLPPGTKVSYWWTLYNDKGREYVTAENTLIVDDERYQWREMDEGLISLYWYSGDDSFADELMNTARQALEKLETDTGAKLMEPVSLYIYDSSQALQGSMVFPQEWTGGVAFTNFNTIAIGIETSELAWGKRAIVHELAHLVTNQMTGNPYNSIPTWLNEGLSMYAEGNLGAIYTVFYKQAIDQQNLISVRSLASPFSASPELAYLSYAESYHIVKYLIDQYGQDKMSQLLQTFAEGASADGALMEVYGFEMDRLDKEWREYAYSAVPGQSPQTVIWTPWLVALIVLVAGASMVIGVWLFYPQAVARNEEVDN